MLYDVFPRLFGYSQSRVFALRQFDKNGRWWSNFDILCFNFSNQSKKRKMSFVYICFSVWGYGGWDQYCRWKLLLQSWQNLKANLSTLRIFGRQTNVLHQRTYLNWTFKFIINKLLIINLFTLITIYLCDDAIVPIWFILMILLCEWSSDLYKKYLFIKT